jgi:hypothetical protein
MSLTIADGTSHATSIHSFPSRGLWRKAFLENHGSGLVSEEVEIEIEKEEAQELQAQVPA